MRFRVLLLTISVVTAGTAQAKMIAADSSADWVAATVDNGVPNQGELNWFYGYYATDGAPATFAQLPLWATAYGWWGISGSTVNNPIVGQTVMHPGWDGPLANRWAVRRWMSEVTGSATIAGTVQDGDLGGGDGIALRFYVNDVELSAQAIGLTGFDGSVHSFSFTAPLVAGQPLDFAIDDKGNPFWDSTQFSVTVATPEPTAFALLGGALLALRHRRRSRGR